LSDNKLKIRKQKNDKYMTMPEPKKVYVRPDGTVVLTCPHCSIQREVQAESFRGYKHKLKIKCSCKEMFMVFIEFRNRVRKKTHLRGTYINHSQDDSNGFLIIQDVSVTGLSFTSLDLKKFKVGDKLKVEFTLDDEHRTQISKGIIVRDIRKQSAGCQYEDEEEVAFGSPLGYFVMT
jgi:hypothetical protein